MFRHNRNETNRNKNIRPTGRGNECNPACQANTCAGQNPFIPERDTSLIDPIEEDRRNDSLNFSRNLEDEEFFPHFIQGSTPMHNRRQPEFRATQITRIQTTIMDEEGDDEEEEECECSNNATRPSPNVSMRSDMPTTPAQNLKTTTDSMLMKPNLASDRNSMLPHFEDENKLVARSAPFTPRREAMPDEAGDPDANINYIKEFGKLVSNQRDNLETQFIDYKVKLRESKSLRAILMRKKYLLMSIPLVLCLLWLMLLLGVLIGSVFCSGMEECPWTKSTTVVPRFMYTSHSVF